MFVESKFKVIVKESADAVDRCPLLAFSFFFLIDVFYPKTILPKDDFLHLPSFTAIRDPQVFR